MVYVNAVFQRASEARVSRSLKLEGALSGHVDPDIFIRGEKGGKAQPRLTTDCVPGTVRGDFASLPMDKTDSSLCLNYFSAPPPPPSRYLSV